MRWIEAGFVRGGTSKGLCFRAEQLPGGLELPGAGGGGRAPEREEGSGGESGNRVEDRFRERDRLLCTALGSPDPYGRQLDGMGGGISSLSKAMIVGRSERPGVDLAYTFAQVGVGEAVVDYSGNCGNLSSAVVPFALAAGLIEAEDGPQRFTLFNVNTRQTVVVRLTVEGGQAATRGAFELPGVGGAGSPIELVYPDSGGSRTSGALPTGSAVDVLQVEGAPDGQVRVSLVDATIPLVLVEAGELGLSATESPEQLDADTAAMELLERIRRAGAVRMGLCAHEDAAPLAVPKITLVAAPRESRLLDGRVLPPGAADVLVRPVSMGQAHRAVPGTGAMCLAAAARIGGTVVERIVGPGEGPVRLGTPTGVVTASAVVDPRADKADGADAASQPHVVETSLARTARVLMMGRVAIP